MDEAETERMQTDETDGNSSSSTSAPKGSVNPWRNDEAIPADVKYQTQGSKMCIIINNELFHSSTGQSTRRGTKTDADAIKKTLGTFGFDFLVLENVRVSEIIQQLQRKASSDLSSFKLLFCVVLSHGQAGTVYGIDGQLAVEKLVNLFNERNCPSMKDKPKIFIIQSCRGNKMDPGVTTDDPRKDFPAEIDNGSDNVYFNMEKDFLVAYSTPIGYFSWRNEQNGSYFVQTLCEVLKKYGASEVDFQHLLVLTLRRVAVEFESNTGVMKTSSMHQMPTFTSTLTKLLHLH